MLLPEIDVFVNLVRNDNQLGIGTQKCCQRFQLIATIYRSCWVTRRTEYNHPRFLVHEWTKHVGIHLEIVLQSGIHNTRSSSGQLHHFDVTYPVRCGQ